MAEPLNFGLEFRGGVEAPTATQQAEQRIPVAAQTTNPGTAYALNKVLDWSSGPKLADLALLDSNSRLALGPDPATAGGFLLLSPGGTNGIAMKLGSSGTNAQIVYGGAGVDILYFGTSDWVTLAFDAGTAYDFAIGGFSRFTLNNTTATFPFGANAVAIGNGYVGSGNATRASTGAFRMGNDDFLYGWNGTFSQRLIGVDSSNRNSVGNGDGDTLIEGKLTVALGVEGDTNSVVLSGTDLAIKSGITPNFGAHSAIGAETVTGYIEIKDAGGTTRKLAVVS